MLKTITPIDNSIYVERNYASSPEIENALNISKKASIEWQNKSLNERKKILTKFVKDMSVETNNAETYIFVKENIDKYNLTLNIKSNPLKNGMIGVDTTFKFEDKNINEFRSNFEVTFSAVVKLNNKKASRDPAIAT